MKISKSFSIDKELLDRLVLDAELHEISLSKAIELAILCYLGHQLKKGAK